MGIPKKIKVGYRDYKVELWDTAEATRAGRRAEIDMWNNTIRISDAWPLEDQRECIIHEVLHALWYDRALDDTEKWNEEFLVSNIASGLTAVFRDNPGLLKFMEK